jgi:hypothetical protein
VKTRVFGCRKFKKLASDSQDRDLLMGEERFMDRHRSVCRPCRIAEHQTSLALNMLRASSLEAEPSEMYEERLIRKWHLQNVRSSVRYWSPAVFGAAIAGIAVLAALQMITQSSKMPSVPLQGGMQEARNIQKQSPAIPELDFLKSPSRPQ